MVEESGHVRGSVEQADGVHTKQQVLFTGKIDWVPIEHQQGHAELDCRVAGKIRKRLHEPCLLHRELRTDDAGKRRQALRAQWRYARENDSALRRPEEFQRARL